MSLLDREPTPEDIEAERDEPRPGVWAGEHEADMRALTQDETDALIRAELWSIASASADAEAIASALGGRDAVAGTTLIGGDFPGQANAQRGGIDSDPLVRVLARRAWGDRDREWFELRGVRKGEAVAFVDTPMRGPAIAKAWQWSESWRGECVEGVAHADARPGEKVAVSNGGVTFVRYRVGDRLREPPSDRLHVVDERTLGDSPQLDSDQECAVEERPPGVVD